MPVSKLYTLSVSAIDSFDYNGMVDYRQAGNQIGGGNSLSESMVNY